MASRRTKQNFENRLYDRRKARGNMPLEAHPNKGSQGMQDPNLQLGRMVRVLTEAESVAEAPDQAAGQFIHMPAPKRVIDAIHRMAMPRPEASAPEQS